MSLLSQILARRWRLPRAETHEVVCERDLRVEMDDRAVLLAPGSPQIGDLVSWTEARFARRPQHKECTTRMR